MWSSWRLQGEGKQQGKSPYGRKIKKLDERWALVALTLMCLYDEKGVVSTQKCWDEALSSRIQSSDDTSNQEGMGEKIGELLASCLKLYRT